MHTLSIILALTGALLMTSPVKAAQEFILYMGGDGAGAVPSLEQHASKISIIAPQAYGTDAEGNVFGSVHPELMAVAREHDVRVMPLIHNPGFHQGTIHALLSDPAARLRTIEFMVGEGLEKGYWGWQFDFENIHSTYRDAYTEFYKEASDELYDNGMTLSVAVVPTDNQAEESGFSRYMQDNWRGSFDLRALADAGEFISLMTYAQHGGPTAPGPIAGLPWMRRMIDFARMQGIPEEKISIGIPFYSGYWYPDFDDEKGARVVGNEVSHERAIQLMGDATPVWLEEQGASMVHWEHVGTFRWVFLEDARSFEAKMDLFDEYSGLRGASIWVMGAEDPAVWELIPERE